MNEPAPPSERRGRAAAAFVAVAAWLAFGAFSLLPYRPPAAVSGISPRLLAADVAALAEAPRPTATAAAAEARRYLVRRLRAGGLAPQLQEIPGRTGEAAGSGAVNVLARLPGTGDGAALLFSAHYDSVPGSPGAADDAAAVAALLQVASRLAAAPPRRNDLIFLFSDGEEEGLTGARAFAGLHPWAEDVRLVANFDALGSRGPSLLFRTAGAAAPALAALATGPRPAGSSLGEEMFRHLGHRTDLDALAALRAPAPPVPALDFALVLGSSTYHRPGDVPAALDLRSALHHASHALVLATALGDAELPPVGGPEPPPAARRVYFNLPPGLLIHYPATRALLLASGILLGVVLLAGALVRRGRARPGRMLADALRVPVDALAGAGLLAVVHGAIFSGGGGPAGEPWQGLYLGSLGLVAVAAVVVLHAGDSARQAPGDGALAGPALAWGLAAVAAAATAPGASHLFLVPATAAAVGLALLLPGGPPRPLRRGIAAALAGGALLVWVPAVWLMAAALRNGRLAAVATGAVAALVAPLLLRPAGLLPRGRRGYVAAGLVAAVGTIAAILAVRLG